MSLLIWVIILFLILIGVFVFSVSIIWWIRKRVLHLSADFVNNIMNHMMLVVKPLSKYQQIIEYDKILDRILGELGHTGTLAQKLQQYEKRNSLGQDVWGAHRERNKLVHEVGYQPSHDELSRHVIALEREVKRILKRGH